jgi:membrane-bound lytic murein transglycosylase D
MLFLLAACETVTQEKSTASEITHPKAGTGFPVTPSSNSDEDAVTGLAEAPEEDIWDRIRNGFGLPEIDDPLIDNHLRWYGNNQQHINNVTERSHRYIHYVVSELEANGMPLELALLPIIESSYNPFAYSTHKAAGIWQFIPGTGKSFGLEQTIWYDGRRDVVASTDAAIRYLKRLHTMFNGDWLLALAAYNAGEGTIRRAVAKNRKAGKPTDFWSLSLPPQTQSYVPRLLALSRIVALPDEFELTLSSIPDDPYFALIDLDSQINLLQLAQLTDIDVKEIQQLNAGYSRWLTNPSGPHQILVPVGDATEFSRQLELLPKQTPALWQEYKVVRGDSLSSIAQKFSTNVNAIKTTNNLQTNNLRIGQTLQIAGAVNIPSEYPSAEELMQNFRKPTGASKVYHTVKAGDSLWKISRQHKTSVKSLTRLNNLSSTAKLKLGQKLIVSTAGQPELLPTDEPHKMIYQIQPGDTLHTIATRFKLSTQKILEWNSVKDASYIHPGQRLTLFMRPK